MIDIKILKKQKSKTAKESGGSIGGSSVDLTSVYGQLSQKLDKEIFRSVFVPVNKSLEEMTWENAIGSDDFFAIKVNKGFFSMDFVSAKGINPDAGGGAGSSLLSELNDVLLGNLEDGQSLVYDAVQKKWVNKRIERTGGTGGIDSDELERILSGKNYAFKTDIPSLTGYATEQWVKNQGYLTSSSLNGYATQQWVRDQNYLTKHQDIFTLTLNAGKFSAGSYNPKSATGSFNIPTRLSHLTNDLNFLTLEDLEKLFKKVTLADGTTAIEAQYGFYSLDFISAKGANKDTGASGGKSYLYDLLDVNSSAVKSPIAGQALVYRNGKWTAETIQTGLDINALESYLSGKNYAAQSWVEGKNYLTSSSLNGYLLRTTADGLYQPKGDYALASQLGNYLPLSGGTVTGPVTLTSLRPLIFTSNPPYIQSVNGFHFVTQEEIVNSFSADLRIGGGYIDSGTGCILGRDWLRFGGLYSTFGNFSESVTGESFIKSGGTSSQFLKADGSIDSNSYLTISSASETYVKKSGDTMTGTLTISHDTANKNHLSFARASWNYISAITEGGILAFTTNGLTPSSTNGTLYLEGKNGYPGASNTGSWGTSSRRWSNLYSVLGDFSGAVTMSSTLGVALHQAESR